MAILNRTQGVLYGNGTCPDRNPSVPNRKGFFANLCDFLRIVVNRRVQTVSEQIKYLGKRRIPIEKVKDGGVYIRI